MRVVIAPDSFKGTLDAAAAASAIRQGWLQVRPTDEVLLIPQADGGEGTVAAISATYQDAEIIPVDHVTGPADQLVSGEYLRLPDGSAVVELAQMSGIGLMTQLDAAGSTTRGLGEVIRAALRTGPPTLTVALGGSASTDGGAGALAALGMRLLDSDGEPIPDGGEALGRLFSLDSKLLLPAPEGGVDLLTDVSAPLLGPLGAAAVFGPQKGADSQMVAILEAALENFSGLIGPNADAAQSGSGAAGGTAFGLMAWGGDRSAIVPGAARIAELTGLSAALRAADVVITGEGKFDSTSMTGKVVGHLLGLPTSARRIVIAGQLAAEPGGDTIAISLTELAGSSAAAMTQTSRWLRDAGRQAALALT